MLLDNPKAPCWACAVVRRRTQSTVLRPRCPLTEADLVAKGGERQDQTDANAPQDVIHQQA